MISIKKQVTG